MSPVASRTAEDLLRFREPGKTAELVRGMLIVREPPGTGHGARAARLTLRVGVFVERHDLGQVFAQDRGFKIERDPDTVRAPDGVRVVWVLDQKWGDARIYRADGTVSTVEPDGELNGEDVLPGFRCPLRDIRSGSD